MRKIFVTLLMAVMMMGGFTLPANAAPAAPAVYKTAAAMNCKVTTLTTQIGPPLAGVNCKAKGKTFFVTKPKNTKAAMYALSKDIGTGHFVKKGRVLIVPKGGNTDKWATWAQRKVGGNVVIVGVVNYKAPAKKDYFNWKAKAVAKDIGCKQIRQPARKNYYKMNSVICNLKGKRVNVMAFQKHDGLMGANHNQWSWEADAKHYLPKSFYWASGKGAVIVAKDGNKAAAQIGAKSLMGKVQHG